MRLDEALKRRETIFKKRMKIRLRKGHDYAVEESIHRNFEAVAKICKILNVDITTSYGTCIFYIILKLDRTCNLLFRQQDKPKCEALEDTVAVDLPNYVDLLDEILLANKLYGNETS